MTRRRTRANEHRRQRNRRLGRFPGRRFVLGLAVLLTLLGDCAALAGASPGSDQLVTATVYSDHGTRGDSVTLGQLQANPSGCPTYSGQSMNELGRQGFVDVPLAPNATWTLPTILGCLQTPIPLASVTGATVVNSNGSPEVGVGSQLTPADLASTGSDFHNSSEYPVVQALGSVNQYDRPWRGNSSGQADYDFLDEVQESQNDQPAPISIEVFEGPHLTVAAHASQTRVPVGTTVSFSATVTGADDSGLAYSWNFDGGAASSAAATPQVTFDTAGTYEVTVQVTDSAGGGGGAAVEVTVGSPPPAASGGHNRKGAGKSRTSLSVTGPQKSSGDNSAAAAGGHRSQSSSPGQTGTSAHGQSSSGQPSSAPSAGQATRLRPPPTARAQGRLVAGQLIGDVTPMPPGSSPFVHPSSTLTSATPARQAPRASPLPALAAVFGVVLLLGLGAGRELRGRRAWHAPQPSS